MSTASSEAVRRHPALIWLIHGTGALLAGASAIVTVYVPYEIVIRTIRGDTPSGWLGLIGVPFIAGVFGFIFKRGYDMFRKLNAVTVADFSSIVALILACGWHHFLPPQLPKGIAAYCAGNPFLIPFADKGPGPTYRYWLSLLAFVVFYKLIKASLLRVLELNPTAPPKAPTPPNSDLPDGPFVPFNPYDLSKNPPYHTQS